MAFGSCLLCLGPFQLMNYSSVLDNIQRIWLSSTPGVFAAMNTYSGSGGQGSSGGGGGSNASTSRKVTGLRTPTRSRNYVPVTNLVQAADPASVKKHTMVLITDSTRVYGLVKPRDNDLTQLEVFLPVNQLRKNQTYQEYENQPLLTHVTADDFTPLFSKLEENFEHSKTPTEVKDVTETTAAKLQNMPLPSLLEAFDLKIYPSLNNTFVVYNLAENTYDVAGYGNQNNKPGDKNLSTATSELTNAAALEFYSKVKSLVPTDPLKKTLLNRLLSVNNNQILDSLNSQGTLKSEAILAYLKSKEENSYQKAHFLNTTVGTYVGARSEEAGQDYSGTLLMSPGIHRDLDHSPDVHTGAGFATQNLFAHMASNIRKSTVAARSKGQADFTSLNLQEKKTNVHKNICRINFVNSSNK